MTVKFTVFDSTTGEISHRGQCARGSLRYQPGSGQAVVEGYFDGKTHYMDIESGASVEYPIRPTRYHDFDWSNHVWRVSAQAVNNAKADAKQKIDIERSRASELPIEYDQKVVDADERAIQNIVLKLRELDSGDALGGVVSSENLIWRDANNVTHTWQNVQQYRAWLQGLLIAISNRATLLNKQAWAKKSDVDALSDIDDIIKYDAS